MAFCYTRHQFFKCWPTKVFLYSINFFHSMYITMHFTLYFSILLACFHEICFNWLRFHLSLGAILSFKRIFVGRPPIINIQSFLKPRMTILVNCHRSPWFTLSTMGIVPFQKSRFVILCRRTFHVESFLSKHTETKKHFGMTWIRTLDFDND